MPNSSRRPTRFYDSGELRLEGLFPNSFPRLSHYSGTDRLSPGRSGCGGRPQNEFESKMDKSVNNLLAQRGWNPGTLTVIPM